MDLPKVTPGVPLGTEQHPVLAPLYPWPLALYSFWARGTAQNQPRRFALCSAQSRPH